MPHVQDLNLDSTEMLIKLANGKKIISEYIAYEKIQKIASKEEKESSWFRTKTIKKLQIYVKGYPEPFTIRNDIIKNDYPSTESFFRNLAEKNDITWEDQTHI